MKKLYRTFALLVSFIILTSYGFCQDNPKLSYSSSGLHINSGSINTELLSDIIVSKQEEIKIRVFKNLIINNYIKSSHEEKNFTMYYYMYKTINNLTIEKNKKIITQKTTNNLIEFALVYSFVAAILEKYGNDPDDSISQLFLNDLQFLAKIDPSQRLAGNDKLVLSDLLLLKNNKTLIGQKSSEFLREQSVPYNDDSFSKYQKQQQQQQQRQEVQKIRRVNKTKKPDPNIKRQQSIAHTKQILINFLVDMAFDYLRDDTAFTDKKLFSSIGSNDVIFNEWRKSDSHFKKLYQSDDDENNIRSNIEYINMINYMKNISKSISCNNDSLCDIERNEINEYAFNIKRIHGILMDLDNDGFNINKLTKVQFENYKQLLLNIISILRNTEINNTISSILNLSIDYTLMQIEDANNGYLFLDIESLVQALDQKYNNQARRSSVSKLALVPRPYFNIGINNGLFINRNTLGESGSSLDYIYLASEKVGLKIKIYDWKYKNSFMPGEAYKIWGKPDFSKTPRKEPLIADLYVSIFGSGVLYNIANLKTEKSFTSGFVGLNTGISFYNGLILNFGYARPFNTGLYKRENDFFSISFDIPIIEYITSARKNK